MLKKTTLFVAVLTVFTLFSPIQASIWDGGHYDFTEGSEPETNMYNGATADISGGWIGILCLYDTCSADIYDGSNVDLIRPYDSSSVDIFGGTIGMIYLWGNSSSNIYSGSLRDLDAINTSVVKIFSDTYNYNPNGGDFSSGLISGEWLDNSGSFSINLVNPGTYDHIIFVPEPLSFSFLLIGSFYLIRREKIKYQ